LVRQVAQRQRQSPIAPGSGSERPSGECGAGSGLSIEHRDDAEDGCPSAALLDEIGRSADATKRAYTDGLLGVIDDIAGRLASDDPRSARVKTLSIFTLMVGTIEVSRALADRQLADDLLEQGIQTALALRGNDGQE
jgi:TetR/AcrR family transcriptional regulator, transcriptional repressor for nem operon